MTKNAYLNTKDFPAKILMTIDDESFVLVFNLSPEGQVYFDQIPVDSLTNLYPDCGWNCMPGNDRYNFIESANYKKQPYRAPSHSHLDAVENIESASVSRPSNISNRRGLLLRIPSGGY